MEGVGLLIRICPAPEPANFQAQVRTPGLRALAEMVGEEPPRAAGKRFKTIATTKEEIPPAKFPDYWRKILPELMSSYNDICAYSCFRIHAVTGANSVDHFACKSMHWNLAYEWVNYRLASSLLNSRKRDFTDVLDPFELQDGWFELELVGFQVIPGSHLDEGTKAQVENTITRLRLNRIRIRSRRAEDAEDYWSNGLPLAILRRESPFVAKELQRQERLLEEDMNNEAWQE